MEVISYKEAPPGSKYLAEIEVYHDRTFWRRIRLMQSQKGHHFVNLPVYGEDDGRGGKKWIQFYEKSKSEDEEFKRLIMEAIQPYMAKFGHSMQPVMTSSAPMQAQAVPQPSSKWTSECPF